MTKPYADIRKALVEGIRNNPDKPAEVKHAAEAWISNIDEIHERGADAENMAAFNERRVDFFRKANGEPPPALASPAEIAKAFGLGDGGE